MHVLEANADSGVNYLITELCQIQAKQHGLEAHTAVGKLKSTSYAILLKKTCRTSSHSDDRRPEYRDFDPQCMLDKQFFAAKLEARTHPEKLAQFEKYKEQLEFIYNEPYFQENVGRAILQFLIAMKSVQNDSEHNHIPYTSELLVPGPFTLNFMQTNRYYPTEINQNWLRPQPKCFKGVSEFKTNNSSFLPKFFPNSEPNQIAAVKKKYSVPVKVEHNYNDFILLSSLSHEKYRIGLLKPCAFRLAAGTEGLKNNKYFSDRMRSSKFFPCKTETKLEKEPKIKKEPVPRCFSWNWESLGGFGIPKVKPFFGESLMSLELKSVICKSEGRSFEAHIVSMEQFMQDLKAVTVGIQSDTFQHDKAFIFYIKPNVTVSGILPSTIAHYAEHFLECGTCYKRMKSMIMKRDYKFIFDGFIFRGLCSALDEYLFTFRQFVFAQNDTNLIEFFKRMKKCMRQMRNLAFTVAIHPLDVSPKPPLGSHFLGYLYREILRSTERDYITLLMFIMKRCCHFYFKHLQQWIFKGILDDPSNELFIYYVEHYGPQTKYYYDKAYQIDKEAVPGFFQSYEQQILQCGKYTMLLKSYKPNHPIFDVEHPALDVCLTYDEIQKLEAACVQYKKSAEYTLEKPTSVKEIFEQRAAEKRNFLIQVRERARDTLKEWLNTQHELVKKAADQKRKINILLSEQLDETRMRKLTDRKLSVENELKALQDAEKLKENRLLIDNINLTKRIQYYKEIYQMLETEINEETVSTSNNLESSNNIPSIGSSKSQDNRTTPSTGEYMTCKDDFDEDEVFSECLSEEFVKSFAETEKELMARMETAESTKDEKNVPVLISYQRSKSDLINSNTQSEEPVSAVQSVVLSDMQQNKVNMLSADGINDCLNEHVQQNVHEIVYTEIQQNKNHMLSGISMQNCLNENNTENIQMIDDMPKNTLTDAQRNKLRVLTAECEQIITTSSADINLNTEPSAMSDLRRNRQRNMSNEPFNDMYDEREKLKLNLKNEQSALNINDLTPMSTTSDAMVLSVTEAEDDKNNNNEPKPVKILFLKDYYANQEKDEDLEEEWHSATRSEKEDFDRHEASITADDSGLMLMDYYTSPYKRCEELLKSNFKCPPLTPYIRLNNSEETLLKSKVVRETSTNQSLKSKATLNVMSVITLTDFLQKSLIIPMQTHLELVKNEVMRMMLVDLRVMEHLRSLRNYFLLMDGEFGSIICDNIIQKMEDGASPTTLLNYQTLHAILETALGASMTNINKNADNLSFIVTEIPDKFDLNSPNALASLTLSYNVKWPLNLILNVETIDQYSKIFKYLLKVRRISWILERVFHILKHAVNEHGKHILKSPQYRCIQQMRHKLYHFLHALQNHITANALEASWKTFKDDLVDAKTIEDIYRKHTKYIKRIIFLCMLNRKSISYLSTIENIFKISLKFYHNLKSFPFELLEGEEHFTHPRYEKLLKCEKEFDKCLSYVIYLGNKIVRHGYQEEVGEFITLINFNHHYSKSKNLLLKHAAH